MSPQQIEFKGKHLDFLKAWDVPERDLEGALSCGKTTVALWSELEAYKRWPGIWGFLSRWTDDALRTLLRPAFEQLARIHGTTWRWNREENAYEFENGSRAFAFGLKTQSQAATERYGKIRGLPVSRIYVDQAEQLPADIASELRARLRPDIEARLRGETYPRQLTFTPNPVNDDHWIAKDFPITNKIKGRRYWSLSLHDNAHNLPPEMIQTMELSYPPEHPKHRTVILGQRGLNVTGDPIYENLFDRAAHVRMVEDCEGQPLIEAFEVGRHNPTWIIGRRTHHGGLIFLGGIMGKHLVLEDFLPWVMQARTDWYPTAKIATCASPMGETIQSAARYTLLNVLREAGFAPQSRENANAADVQLAMIEHMAGLLRRRTMAREESITINKAPDRWLYVFSDGTVKEVPFLAFSYEGGYVWDDHVVSISNKTVRQPFDDDEYANAMRCVENLLLNFSAGRLSEADRQEQRNRSARHQRADPPDESFTDPYGWLSH